MSYLYHVVALTLLYLPVVVALQSVPLFLSYKVSVHVCNSLKWACTSTHAHTKPIANTQLPVTVLCSVYAKWLPTAQ